MDDLAEQPSRRKYEERHKSLAKRTHNLLMDVIKRQHLELTHDSHIPELLNPRGFEEIVIPATEMFLQEGDQVVFGFIDMDKMKAINDKYGHPKGDEVIKKLAEVLQKYFKRETDIIALNHPKEGEKPQGGLARRGGDEFLLAIALTDIERVKMFLQDAKEEFEKEAQKITPEIVPSFSFGLASMREKLEEIYDRDKIQEGNLAVSQIKAVDAEPSYLMVSALQVAEMRMYKDKAERGQART